MICCKNVVELLQTQHLSDWLACTVRNFLEVVNDKNYERIVQLDIGSTLISFQDAQAKELSLIIYYEYDYAHLKRFHTRYINNLKFMVYFIMITAKLLIDILAKGYDIYGVKLDLTDLELRIDTDQLKHRASKVTPRSAQFILIKT